MYINKIAKGMTREEFLNSCYINNENGISYCPGIFDLKNFPCHSHICDPKENCKECWEDAIKDIKFKGEDFMENKINYDREYNIMEIMEFPEGTEFRVGNCMYRIKNGELEYNDELDWRDNLLSLKHTLTLKFKLVKKDKKVTFEEAIQAYGKDIYCIWKDDDEIEHKSEYCIRNEWEQCITDQNCEYLTPTEIVKGEWYIKED
ncbi:hypothetical protein ACTQ4K_00170 [Clostridium sporogenes]|uniref:hypothetical protein n=1 Tax=Clostridium sporogenes TaxID=1509 RepID=UPI003F91CF5B